MIVKRANMLTWCFVLFMISGAVSLEASDSCIEVKLFYEGKGFGQIVPNKAIPTKDGSICGGNYTCCNSAMEDRLSVESTVEFNRNVREKTETITNMLNAKHEQFDKFFHELIGSAKTSLHVLFEETYGDIYMENSEVFAKFFDDLKLYYEGGVVDFTDIFDSFFITLMQQVFKLMNPSFDLNENYMQCMGDNLNVIRPFADLPQKLSNQIQRSFIAARTFVQALKTGERVSQSVSKIYPTTHCAKLITKIMSCSKCNGLVTVKPCKNACLNILQGCLCNYDKEFNMAWNKYLDTSMTVLDRLVGPFDIESVLSPIDVKISEAVMMLQENKKVISESVFQQCGQPPSSNMSFDLSGLSNMKFGNMRLGMGAPENNMNPLSTGDFDFTGFYGNMQTNADSDSINGDPKVGDDNFDLMGLSNLKFDTDIDSSISQPRSGKPRRGKRSTETKERKKNKKRKRSRKRRKNKRRKHRVRDITISKQRQAYGKFFQKMNEPSRLSNLVNEMRTAQKSAEDFWKNLPATICEENSELVAQHDCWDGDTVSSENLADGNATARLCNSEIYGDSAKVPDIVVRQQIVNLREVTAKLWHAHRGIDPAFVDLELPTGNVGLDMADYSGDGSADESNGNEKPKIDESENASTPKKTKNKKMKDLEEREIKLIRHALGKKISLRATLKDIKSRVMKHPQLQPETPDFTEVDLGSFGNLNRSEQQILLEIFEIPHGSKNTAVSSTAGRATDKPVTTTSAASTVTISLTVLCTLSHFFYRMGEQTI
ncbi:glypican-6-like [Styela clava]